MAVPDPEVVVLRERVARLEKRLADADGKIALLMARAESTAPTSSTTQSVTRLATRPPRFDRPQENAAWDLNPPRDAVSVDDGLHSIDIERSRPDESVDDEGVVLRMRGDDAPIIEAAPADNGSAGSSGGVASSAADDDDDPLSALRSAEDLYSWGQARLKEGRHIEAVAAFEDVLARFPRHDLADNSLYWMGVCQQGRGEHRLAIADWQKLPARFPKSPKVPDALFGMAQSHEALGEPAVAEVLYDEIVASYPKAEKHKEARKALSRLRPSR
jgi:tol-pal system protein YbgF